VGLAFIYSIDKYKCMCEVPRTVCAVFGVQFGPMGIRRHFLPSRGSAFLSTEQKIIFGINTVITVLKPTGGVLSTAYLKIF
jgi:hypothetical protein